MDFTFPTMDRVNKAIAREIVTGYRRDASLERVYAIGTRVAPSVFPARAKLSAADLDKATDLLADAYLLQSQDL